jgi:type IV secretion system protein VirB6
MTVMCAAPDPSVGVAYRLSAYLDCQARALGENGFQALAGGTIGTALLSGLITIFVALIGFRLMLGHAPNVRDGVGWMVRVAIVLALVTSWPAFQTLFYRVAVDGPAEIASVLLPASGVAGEAIDGRIQQSYDLLRLGSTGGQATVAAATDAPARPQQGVLGEAVPKTASLLVISTAGLIGALRIAIGFLLAVAPLAIMSLLFPATNGLFAGWLRAITGLALGLAGATVVTAIHLVALESELAHAQALGAAEAGLMADPQALTTLVIFFALVALITTLAAMRMGSALSLAARPGLLLAPRIPARADPQPARRVELLPGRPVHVSAGAAGAAGAAARARAVAETLSMSVRRDQRPAEAARPGSGMRPASTAIAEAAHRHDHHHRVVERIGLAGRRSIARRTRSAARRDQVA